MRPMPLYYIRHASGAYSVTIGLCQTRDLQGTNLYAGDLEGFTLAASASGTFH